MFNNFGLLPEEVQILFFVILGLMIGSFLNVVILRLPKRMFWSWTEQCKSWLKEGSVIDEEPAGIIVKTSHCPNCKANIKAWHNIPVISYLFLLRGKCHSCGKKISIRYPFIEILTACLSGFVFWKFGLTLATATALILTWVLVVHSFIDLDHQLLFDEITYPVLWLGLLLNVFNVFTDPTSAVIGAAAGYMSLWTVYQLFKILTKKEGMGFGDFKLLALLGAWLGWHYLPQIIVISTLTGSIVGLTLIALKKLNKEKPIPFGPYLAIAGWVALIWGDEINTQFFSFI